MCIVESCRHVFCAGLSVAHDALPGDGFGIVSDDFTDRLLDGISKAAAVASQGAAGLLEAAPGGCEAAGMMPCVNASGAVPSMALPTSLAGALSPLCDERAVGQRRRAVEPRGLRRPGDYRLNRLVGVC